MGGRHFVAAWALAGLAFAGASQAAQDFTLVDLGTLGGSGSYGAAVTNGGVVVGCADSAGGETHAFIYQSGAMRDLGGGCALAVNDAGVAAGRSATGELVVWSAGSMTRLGLKGDIGGINASGTIAGTASDGASSRAFTARDGAVTLIAGPDSSARAINARGEIAGTANGRAFLLANVATRDLGTLGGNGSAARGINTRGEVVGMSTDENGAPLSFVYHGAMIALPAPAYSSAIGINDHGQVVGSGEGIRGFLIDGDTVTRLDSLPAVVARGWRRLEPTGINDRGWIVGTGSNADGDLRAFLLVPASEVRSKPLRFRTK